jgi:hypothetical protein
VPLPARLLFLLAPLGLQLSKRLAGLIDPLTLRRQKSSHYPEKALREMIALRHPNVRQCRTVREVLDLEHSCPT